MGGVEEHIMTPEEAMQSTVAEAFGKSNAVIDETFVVFQVQVDVKSDLPTRPKSADDARPSFTSTFISAPAIPTLNDAAAEPAIEDVDIGHDASAGVPQVVDPRPADMPDTDRVSLPRATPTPAEEPLNTTGASLLIPLVDSPSIYHTDDSASITSHTETAATVAISSRSARRMKMEVLTSESDSRSPGTVIMSPSSLLDAPPVPRAGSALSAARYVNPPSHSPPLSS